eukprot:5986393-Amphidinium_carterae.1
MQRCGMAALKPSADSQSSNKGKGTGKGAGKNQGAQRSADAPSSSAQPPQQGSNPSGSKPDARNSDQNKPRKDQDKRSDQNQAKDQRKNEKKGKQGAQDKQESVRSSFALIPEDWPPTMPPQTAWSADTAGVFMTESAEEVSRWGHQCKFSKLPVLAISPARPNLDGYPITKKIIRFCETRPGAPDRI